jgi:5S rRNA maturation endonuclease (ribonuclease M5)
VSRSLVIVESPAKAKTINHYLGSGYIVKASLGHVRDLPKSKMGVDVEHDFAPTYQIIPEKKKVVAELKKLAAESESIILAADNDREGEAISWHLREIIGAENPKVFRAVFNEITVEGIKKAFEHLGGLDMPKIEASRPGASSTGSSDTCRPSGRRSARPGARAGSASSPCDSSATGKGDLAFKSPRSSGTSRPGSGQQNPPSSRRPWRDRRQEGQGREQEQADASLDACRKPLRPRQDQGRGEKEDAAPLTSRACSAERVPPPPLPGQEDVRTQTL